MCRGMAICRLCGYRVSLKSEEELKQQCPICGEAFVVLRHDGRNKMATGLPAAASGAFACGGASAQQHWQSSNKAVHQGRDGTKRPLLSCLNPDLLAMLQLMPGPQNRKMGAQDVVRAPGGLMLPLQKDSNPSEPDAVVYIIPHADPTMRVLKGRYKTQPRTARAVSISALHRLADPLTGYDSMEALAPQVRRRRQESIERLMGRRVKRGKRDNVCGREGRILHKAEGSEKVPRHAGRTAPSRRSLSLNNIVSTGNPSPIARSNCTTRRRGWSSSDVTGLIMERRHDQRRKPLVKPESAKNGRARVPSFPLRDGRGRRAKPNLRRKRVATMWSVNGWVSKADPASARRQMPLERRKLALKNTEEIKTKGGGGDDDEGRNPLETIGSVGGNNIFLTELDADDARSLIKGYGGTGGGNCSNGPVFRGVGRHCGRGRVKDVARRKHRVKGGTHFPGREPARKPRGRSSVRNKSGPFSEACRHGSCDCGGGAVRTKEGAVENDGGELNWARQRSSVRTALGPLTRSPGEKLAGGRRTKLPGENRRRAVIHCAAGDSVNDPLPVLRSNEVEAGSDDRNKGRVASSSRLPGHVRFPEGEAVPKKSNVSEEATRSMAQRGMVHAMGSSRPRLATPQNPGSAVKSAWHVDTSVSTGHSRKAWQSFRDIGDEFVVSARSLSLDNISYETVGSPAQDLPGAEAASGSSDGRPTESLMKVDGRGRRCLVGGGTPPQPKPSPTAALQKSGPMYWQHRKSFPTLFAV